MDHKRIMDHKSIGTHRIALYVNAENVTFFDSFGKIKKFIENKNIISNIYRIQPYHLIMHRPLYYI